VGEKNGFEGYKGVATISSPLETNLGEKVSSRKKDGDQMPVGAGNSLETGVTYKKRPWRGGGCVGNRGEK